MKLQDTSSEWQGVLVWTDTYPRIVYKCEVNHAHPQEEY